MIKSLINLPIRRKFAVIILPLIIIIIGFDYLQIKNNYFDYKDATRLNKAIKFSVEISHAVHELQKERSISVGYISSQGEDFATNLAEQRKRTDSTIQEFYDEIESQRSSNLMKKHEEELDALVKDFERVKSLRVDIDALAISPKESLELFSSINSVAINMIAALINETRDKEVAQQVHAVIYFMKAKESASIERAIGTQAFSNNEIDKDLYNSFTSLVSSQESFLEAFQIIADKASVDYFESMHQGEALEDVLQMREMLILADSLHASPSAWYQASTERINKLKKIENFMTNRLQEHSDKVASAGIQEFWTFLILDVLIGVLTFWLMSVVVTNLLKNVNVLEAFTRRISAGDLSKRVVINTKDELGQYAKTFNQMVIEIRKSHMALRKQRDKAKFLYENIYGVSLTVFQNIQQGIFLLDKDFKISKFHSKAMKDIFNDERIAGENFANFMRPMILPREMEALEMFMRHLFNPDMDEDVVNQLNPVDRVKIHTEQDGVVYTKYIRVEFTRIYRKEVIRNVMVTVSDETESVLLQQHLDEAQIKKQQETERVLSILKIDPSILRGFLYNSTKMLKSISDRYEKHEGEDYTALLSFTMDIIHNLKGNAVVIGMDLMSNKFHEIEEAIVALKNKKRVTGKDFLAILYEIDEANRMIEDIKEMLFKIVDIYKKFPAEGHSATNVMLLEALEKGASFIAKEEGKNVEINFLNEQNIVIPEEYVDPFKDVMIQLIRNSIVHGIESPEDRIKAGKVIAGEVRIELDKTEKDDLVVWYSDDGAGLDHARIKKNALDRGLVMEFEVEKMTGSEIEEMIFLEGFSTSEKSNRHAGRGQGMHLVQSIINDQKGHYKFEAPSGQSFGLKIVLPSVGKKLVADD